MIRSLPPLLLIEDDDAEAGHVERLLDGVSVHRVRSLTEALAVPAPSLTLLDLGLPDARGTDTLDGYLAAFPQVPVVVLTDHDDEGIAREVIRRGAQDFLPKDNISADLLVRTLSHAIERHALDRRLRRANARLRSTIEAAPDLIMEIDRRGRIHMTNRGIESVTAEDLLGEKWTRFVSSDNQQEYERARARVFGEGESITYSTSVERPDGAIAWFEVTMAPVGTSPIERAVVICRDVTETHLQQERFELALEAAPAGMVVVDDEGTIVMANRTVQTILGYASEELVGQSIDVLVPAKLREQHVHDRQRYHEEPTARGVMGGRKVTALCKDGAEIPIEVGLTPIQTSRGVEILCSIVDMRSRRALEEQLHHSQKLEAVGQLAGGVAHDFNNLLTAILSFGDYVRQELPEGSRTREDMDEVLAAAHRATSLTSQLLAFSRRQPVSPRVVSLIELVGDLRKMLGRVIGEDVSLRTELDDDCPHVEIDPGVFEHVLLNLAINARDAMAQGGELFIGCTRDTVSQQAIDAAGSRATPGTFARLRVRDDGVGMDADTRRRIFEPFFTTKPHGRGTGLGLSTVYGMVSQAGGLITVDSEPGEGTTFDIHLPMADPRKATAASSAPPTTAGGNERILVIEDDDQVRAVTRRCLKRLGYDVTAAANGAEALDIVAGDRDFDLIITDLVMPDINGAELAEQLSTKLTAQVLFMTGYAPESIEKRGIFATGEILHKPFTPTELGQRVRELLDG